MLKDGLTEKEMSQRTSEISVEIINWVLDNMKNPRVCKIIETKMND
ncbi:hypothetical protein BH18THE1_BH18THE1_11730 [soil metagenome]